MTDAIRTGMHLVVVVLFDESCIGDVILGLTSISGGHVTMLDAVSGAENLSHVIPMFAEFSGRGGHRYCKVMFTCVQDDDPVGRFIGMLENAGYDFVGDGLGEVYAVRLSQAVTVDVG